MIVLIYNQQEVDVSCRARKHFWTLFRLSSAKAGPLPPSGLEKGQPVATHKASECLYWGGGAVGRFGVEIGDDRAWKIICIVLTRTGGGVSQTLDPRQLLLLPLLFTSTPGFLEKMGDGEASWVLKVMGDHGGTTIYLFTTCHALIHFLSFNPTLWGTT